MNKRCQQGTTLGTFLSFCFHWPYCTMDQVSKKQNQILWGSDQDGAIGRNPSLPHTTKSRITTNPKSINNQKCHKINMRGILTTKELKKQSTRPTRLVHQNKEIWPKRKNRPNSRKRAKRWADSQPIWRRVKSPGDQNAHRTDWAWSQDERTNEDYPKWNKVNVQGTNSDRKETRTQINSLEWKEEINMQLEQNEERIQKMKRSLGTSGTTLNVPIPKS